MRFPYRGDTTVVISYASCLAMTLSHDQCVEGFMAILLVGCLPSSWVDGADGRNLYIFYLGRVLDMSFLPHFL